MRSAAPAQLAANERPWRAALHERTRSALISCTHPRFEATRAPSRVPATAWPLLSRCCSQSVPLLAPWRRR